MKVLEGLYYTKEHEWVKVDGAQAYVGITDFAQQELGDIVFVELPELGLKFSKGDEFGVVESVKAASDIYIPISGKILKVNETLIDNPGLLNEDAYKNFIAIVEISDKLELTKLLNSQEYEELFKED